MTNSEVIKSYCFLILNLYPHFQLSLQKAIWDLALGHSVAQRFTEQRSLHELIQGGRGMGLACSQFGGDPKNASKSTTAAQFNRISLAVVWQKGQCQEACLVWITYQLTTTLSKSLNLPERQFLCLLSRGFRLDLHYPGQQLPATCGY